MSEDSDDMVTREDIILEEITRTRRRIREVVNGLDPKFAYLTCASIALECVIEDDKMTKEECLQSLSRIYDHILIAIKEEGLDDER